jgi:hypothetical protein
MGVICAKLAAPMVFRAFRDVVSTASAFTGTDEHEDGEPGRCQSSDDHDQDDK